jgi:predicted transport protein
MLRKLENYGQKELVNIESCTIEHIMPQNEQLSVAWQEELGPAWKEMHAKYLHTIGNLTLTGYNSELSDRSFREKHEMEGGFAHSPIRLNRGLGNLEHWNREEIEKRAQALANIAVKVWPFPLVASEEASKHLSSFPTEIIGPLTHLQAGFIPAGFKIIQHSEKRFYLFRNIHDEWVQYGNGQKPWWAVSWQYAGEWARDKYRKNEMPSGIGGEKKTQLELKAQYLVIEDTNGSNGYTLQDYPGLQGDMRAVFEQLRKRILNLDSSVKEEYKKQYIAYKTTTNFVDIEPQKKKLLITLNMKFDKIIDPKELCRDVTNIGHFGNGDIEIAVSSLDEIDDVMDLVRQSFEEHWEEGDA